MNMSDINMMCRQKVRPDFGQILKFSSWTKYLDISSPGEQNLPKLGYRHD